MNSAAPTFNLLSLRVGVEPYEDSYFDETMLCVSYALRSAGFKVVQSVNRYVEGAINVIWGAGTHLFPDLSSVRRVAKPSGTVIFNMEQLGGESPLLTSGYFEFLSDYVVWDYNLANLLHVGLRGRSQRGIEFPVSPCQALAGVELEEPGDDWFDVVFYGARNARRERLIASLVDRGVRVKWPSAFGRKLVPDLRASTLVLNVHAYSTAIFEMTRVLRPVAMGIPVVSETSVMPEGVDWARSGIVFADYSRLGEACVALLEDSRQQLRMARRSIAFCAATDIQSSVREAVEHTLELLALK